MKKVLLTAVAIFNIVLIHAQGTYQLWGTKRFGGPDELGSIFSTDAFGNNFHSRNQTKAINPGNTPKNSVLSKYGEKYYGVTSGGGLFESGVIFEWDPATNIYTKKIDFPQYSVTPSGCLTLFNNKFYGVTNSIIFEWDPLTNFYTQRFNFPIDYQGQGRVLATGTLMLMNNKFYGITNGEGTKKAGGIFEWDPVTNIYIQKQDFNDHFSLGYEPCGNLIPVNGKFYGMTSYGGNDNRGVIFEWDPLTNIYLVKLNFDTNGYRPNGSLFSNGNKFYGATNLGGSNNLGILFEWDTSSNVYTKKIDLDASTGNLFFGSFISNESKLYGMMTNGGSSNTGSIFEWNITSGTFTKKIDLDDSTGNYPTGSLVSIDGKFYGMTDAGGRTKLGVLFQWDPTTNGYVKKIELDNRESGALPVRTVSYYKGKMYGMTMMGGNNGAGVIFTLDPATNLYTKKVDFAGAFGTGPIGSLTLLNGKFYGATSGSIFEWDPLTNILTKKIDLNISSGNNTISGLTAYNGKFYGATGFEGLNGLGTIFEWDPATNVFLKKFDFTESTGGQPLCKLSLYDGKFYGLCFANGDSNAGTLFEWNPATNIFTKKIDFSKVSGNQPLSTLTLYNNKFYGTTHGGGVGNAGDIFEWDPATNVYIKKFEFLTSTSSTDWYFDGYYPMGSLIMSNGKFYGITSSGGIYRNGVLYEWDPATNVYTKKIDFTEKPDDNYLGAQDLTLAPAPLAARVPGSCINFPSVTIDASNNSKWISVTDSMGNAVAEINANGNNLGMISSSMYANNGPVREDAAKRLYLDMNLTITPQFQPTTPVDVRLYIKNEEFVSLKNAVNSDGQASGINSITDIAILKNQDDGCLPTINTIADTALTTGTVWEADYVVAASIPSFSSFYFAGKGSTALPFTLLEFSGHLQNNNALLTWKTENEQNLFQFEVQRSIDGTNYFAIGGSVDAFNNAGTHDYSFTDDKINDLGKTLLYYRLKQKDRDGGYSYSRTITIEMINGNSCLFFPNPVSAKATLIINIGQQQSLYASLLDNSGKIVKQLQWHLPAGSTSLSVDVSKLAKGIYFLEIKGATINEHIKFIRQ